MTGLVRKATLLTVCGLMLAGAAMAGQPSPGNSTLAPQVHTYDGFTSTSPQDGGNGIQTHTDFCSTTPFTIRDGNNLAVPNALVVIDLSGCAAGAIKLCTNQDDAGITIDCTAKTASKSADPSGVVVFNLRATGSAGNASLPVCAAIYANGFPMGTITLAVHRYDLDNTGTVGGFDGSLEVTRINTYPPCPGGTCADLWGDFDCTTTYTGFDGTLMVNAILGALAVCTACP